MRNLIARWTAASMILIVAISPLAAQTNYREYFKKPETAPEFWTAMQYEIEVGQFNIAAGLLKSFLEKNPTDDELFQIEERDGIATFLKLLTIPALRKDAAPLVDRVSEVVKQKLSDPVRIRKFIANLQATPEERAYAIVELRRSKAMAVPYLVETLRSSEDPKLHVAILSAMLRLNRDIVPPLLAALDIDDPALRIELIDLLDERAEMNAVPYLWYLSASSKVADLVRSKATAALAHLLGVDPTKLPSAKVVLTQEAEKYYRHEKKGTDPRGNTIWIWDGKQFILPPPVYNETQAEEYYGLKFARQALDLDPTYRPAQIVLLSLALEKAYERAGLDQPLEKGSPNIKDVLRSVNPDLLIAVLDRALADKRLPVALGAIRALGDLTETRAGYSRSNQPAVLVRALQYPDRRVQMAAADALLHMHTHPHPTASTRIVEVLRRALASDEVPRVLIADMKLNRANSVAGAIKQSGFETVVAQTGREVLRRLAEASDIDVLLLDSALPDPGLNYLLAQLRADIDSGLLPILITVAPDLDGPAAIARERSVQRLASGYRNVWVLPATLDPEALKTALTSRIGDAAGKSLSPEEKKANAALAMIWLRRMATNELPGYDVRPAESVILRALQTEDLAPLAIDAAADLPSRNAQRALAAMVLDSGVKPELRSAAAIALTRHMQRNGKALTAEQAVAMEDLFNTTDDPKLKTNVALVVGGLRPSSARTGDRLRAYSPPPVAPTAEKEKEK